MPSMSWKDRRAISPPALRRVRRAIDVAAFVGVPPKACATRSSVLSRFTGQCNARIETVCSSSGMSSPGTGMQGWAAPNPCSRQGSAEGPSWWDLQTELCRNISALGTMHFP